jgi:hypothetical protein
MNSKILFAPKRSASLRLAGLLGVLMLGKLAYAAGETGPVGLQGLPEVLLQISIYPFIGIALSFLVFKVTNKAWVFFFAPFFYWGMSTLVPIVPMPAFEDSPARLAHGFICHISSQSQLATVSIVVPRRLGSLQ